MVLVKRKKALNQLKPFGLSLSKPRATLRQAQRERIGVLIHEGLDYLQAPAL